MAEHHPLGDIEYLTENLLNSYLPGFPILKELVQNAEDAKATCLDYGWIEGIPNATHPLLRSPALFMLDNGEFTNKNAESIRYILGGSSKPNQQDSIGKFGLGLKSVFHLCEAFFYIAPDPERSDYPGCDIFNPWAGAKNKDKYHANWDGFLPKDQDLMKTALQQILEKIDYQEKWFILWIPLRQRSHSTIQDKEDGIPLWIKKGDNEFFDKGIPDFFGNKETKKQLNIVMTLLGTINQIRYWENDFGKPQFEITLKPTSQRRCSLSTLAHNTENLIKGQICEGVNVLDFVGSEIILESPEFNNIVKRPELPEKFRHIKPHNAIVFSRLSDNFSDNKSSLTLRTAVFLPIGEDQAIECQSQYSYYLTLHGYFFVDFARTGVLGWDKNNLNIDKNKKTGDDDRISLEKEWNFYLYEVILTRILYTFDKFVCEYSLSESEISAICKALRDSQLFKESSNREKKICQNKQFILCITPQGKQWKLLDKTKRVLKVPKIPSWDWFPNLSQIAQSPSHLLTLSDAPNLRFDSTTFDEWSDQEIIDIFSNVSESILHNHDAINYLVSFLKEYFQNRKTQKIESDEVQRHLIQFIKKGLSQLNWSKLSSEIKNALKKLINLIRGSEVIYVDVDVSDNIFKDILQIEVSALLLPKLLFADSHNDSLGQLNVQDATTILSTLNSLINQCEQQEKNTRFLEQILRQFLDLSKKYVISSILSKNPYWRCLIGNQYPQKTAIFYSYHDFQDFKHKSILFRELNNNLIQSLVEATENIKPIIVDSKIADLLKNDENVSPVTCDIDTCKNSLSKTPALALPERRKLLLTELLKEVY